MKLYAKLSSLLRSDNEIAAEQLEGLLKQHMPSGSGFDSGTKLDYSKSNTERLVFTTEFHHMNDAGYYDGWTTHTVTVRPSFTGLDVVVSGRDRNQIKDFIADVFYNLNSTEV